MSNQPTCTCAMHGYHWEQHTEECYVYLRGRNRQLEAGRDELLEAIQAHKDSFIGKEEDIVPEDEALWKALLPKEEDV